MLKSMKTILFLNLLFLVANPISFVEASTVYHVKATNYGWVIARQQDSVNFQKSDKQKYLEKAEKYRKKAEEALAEGFKESDFYQAKAEVKRQEAALIKVQQPNKAERIQIKIDTYLQKAQDAIEKSKQKYQKYSLKVEEYLQKANKF